jgi:biotin synthase
MRLAVYEEISTSPAPTGPAGTAAARHDWTLAEGQGLFERPLPDLVYRAQRIHRRHFPGHAVQLSTLLNIKAGGCPEDCSYCPQSARYQTDMEAGPLTSVAEVREAAVRAKAAGATRFCMGAAWRRPSSRGLARVTEMVTAVEALGLETCATLGMLSAEQALELKTAGLDYYNHNLDTSRRYYREIITTRSYDDRLETLTHVRAAGLRVCCGGIIGMGELREDVINLLITLANLPEHPESVPINVLVRVTGTPLACAPPPDPFEVVRTIALARILMPASYVRLSAGRAEMSDELQALCFIAGANSVFYGERLLTTANPDTGRDRRLLERLGMTVEPVRTGH